MKRLNISSLISAIFFYKILDLKKKLKGGDICFFNFIKFSSLFLKKFFILDEIVLSNFTQINYISWNFLKILYKHYNLTGGKILAINYGSNKLFFSFENLFKGYFEIFFQFYGNQVQKKFLLSSISLRISLKLVKEIKKIPSLRIIISGFTNYYKHRVRESMVYLIGFFLQNPIISSKLFIQEIIWSYFRVISKQQLFESFVETRAFVFLNNSQKSLFFFQMAVKFYPIFLSKPFVNFCLKNVHRFVKDRVGHVLILYILQDFFIKKNLWFNLAFLENLLRIKFFTSRFFEIFFLFLFRNTGKIFRKNELYTCLFKLNREPNRDRMIEIIVSKKRTCKFIFLKFIRSKVFQITLTSYPNFLQNEFIGLIEMFTNNREFNVYNEGETCKELLYSYSKNKLLIKKNLLFVQTLKIKKKLSLIQFLFFTAYRILKNFLAILEKSFLFEKNLYRLFSQIIPKNIHKKLNLSIILQVPIKTNYNVLVNLYKNNKIHENY